ncbi:hypothetical protein GEMRC1_011723 [Eukaryota sp. GEM-RC1]
MRVAEFRLNLPLTTHEYHIGQLYTCAIASKNETDGNEGIEIVQNEPYEDEHSKGQYTYKIFHLEKNIPKFVSICMPKSSLILEEKAWNAYPYCKTVYTNGFLGDRFSLEVETMHLDDRGDTPNAINTSQEELDSRAVDHIDIVNDVVPPKDYVPEYDPKIWDSEKYPGRGKLSPDWVQTHTPVMTAYKTVRAKFSFMGLTNKVEKHIMKVMREVFLKYHRQTVCTMDNWIDYSMDDIRKLEDETKEVLANTFQQQRSNGEGEQSS